MTKRFQFTCSVFLLTYLSPINHVIASAPVAETSKKPAMSLKGIREARLDEPDRAPGEMYKLLQKQFKESWKRRYGVDYSAFGEEEGEDKENDRLRQQWRNTPGLGKEPLYKGSFGVFRALLNADKQFIYENIVYGNDPSSTTREWSKPTPTERLDHLLRVATDLERRIEGGDFDPPFGKKKAKSEKPASQPHPAEPQQPIQKTD